MEPRLLAILISSLVSQALLLLLLSLPSAAPNLLLSAFAAVAPSPLPYPLLLHLLSSSHLAAAASSLLPRKRRRQEPPQESHPPTALAPRANPDHFRLHFRMSASTFEWLSGLLDPLLDCRDPRPTPPLPLPPAARLALALSRLATGAPYPVLAARFGVPVPAARFISKHLCRVLCTNFRFWLAFPSSPDLAPLSLAFRCLSGLPGCCGAIALARFDAHGGTIAAQIVADASSRILGIAAGFRGDSKESSILKRSALYGDAQAGRLLGSSDYLVGDGGYPLLPWLMVPYADPARGSCEEDFNAAHQLMRRPVRRVVSSLMNWGVLSRLTEEDDAKVAVACIGTCAILHNVLLMREDYSALSDVTVDDCSVSSEQYRDDDGLEESAVEEEEGLVLRRTLALRAREIHTADHDVCNL